MNTYQKFSLLLLRLSLGWLYLYSGIKALTNPAWSQAVAGYLGSASNFKGFYSWLASPDMLAITSFVNKWALLLLGVSLILGIFVKYSAPLGALLMLMFYLVLPFPHPDPFTYIVDQHIVYAFALIALAAYNAGKFWGLDSRRSS